jgi:multidrug efflux pump subunit AcrB
VPLRGPPGLFIVLAALLTILIGVSRIYLGVHYPTDVLGGWCVGREFAVTVAVAIAVSVVVSLTLTPMMCARLLAPERDGGPGRVSRALERFLDGLVAVYDRALIVALRHRQITLTVMVVTICTTG